MTEAAISLALLIAIVVALNLGRKERRAAMTPEELRQEDEDNDREMNIW